MARSPHSGATTLIGPVRILSRLARQAPLPGAVRRDELGPGDRVTVRTRNSVYTLWSLGDDEFTVQGGWFERQPAPSRTVRISGCTYGGSAIRHDVIAAPGLFLEFESGVVTTRILEVRVERFAGDASPA